MHSQKGPKTGPILDPFGDPFGVPFGPLLGPPLDPLGDLFWTPWGTPFGPLPDPLGDPCWTPFWTFWDQGEAASARPFGQDLRLAFAQAQDAPVIGRGARVREQHLRRHGLGDDRTDIRAGEVLGRLGLALCLDEQRRATEIAALATERIPGAWAQLRRDHDGRERSLDLLEARGLLTV